MTINIDLSDDIKSSLWTDFKANVHGINSIMNRIDQVLSEGENDINIITKLGTYLDKAEEALIPLVKGVRDHINITIPNSPDLTEGEKAEFITLFTNIRNRIASEYLSWLDIVNAYSPDMTALRAAQNAKLSEVATKISNWRPDLSG